MHRLLRRTAGAAAVLGLALCLLSLARQWQGLRPLQLEWSAGTVVAAVAAAALADVVMALGWVHLVRAGGGDIGWSTGVRVWWTGQLARFVPTGLGSVPGRLVAGAGAGLPRRLLSVTTAAELAVAGATSVVAAALLLPGPAGAGVALAGLLAVCLLAAAVVVRLLPGAPAVGPAAVRLVGAHTVKLALRAGGFWAVLHLTTAGRPPGPIAVLAAVGAAYALGLAAVFAPGGIGVREAALAAMLGAAPGGSPSAVLAAAVVWRLLETAVEPPLLVASRLIQRPQPAAAGALP